jgi:hypothetical protein
MRCSRRDSLSNWRERSASSVISSWIVSGIDHTLIAANGLGCRYLGIEREREYDGIAIERLLRYGAWQLTTHWDSRLRATNTVALSFSVANQFRPNPLQAAGIVAPPQNGSTIRSPGSVSHVSR